MSGTTPQTAYYDKKGKPRLVRSYCLFLDFLGFRHEIKTAVTSGKEQAVFQQFMRFVEPEIQRIIVPSDDDPHEPRPRMWDAKVFTDNIVLGYALWSGHGENEFGSVLLQVIEFQVSAALNGHFVRGGWAIGNLFMNPNTVFGAPLLEAYELESTQAVFPRIVLSEGVKDVVRHHMTFYAKNNRPPHCRYLAIDKEGTVFVHYLMWLAEGEEIDWEPLKAHKQRVKGNLAKHKGNERVYAKYEWLAAYHNYFCDYYADEPGYSADYRVKGKFPDFGNRFLERTDLDDK